MKPLRIFMKNFMLHRLSEIDCTQFSTALIVGKSRKDDRVSNGVGKSTIFNAIEYALFNKSHATNLDGIVKEGKRKAVVEFDFEIGGEAYRVYRHRTSSGSGDLRLYQKFDTKWESISGRTPSATEKILQDLIKIKHKSFESSVLFRQAHLTGLSTKDPKERKELLKEPLDLAPYTKLEAIAANKTKPIRKQIDTITKAISYIGNPAERIEESKEQLEKVEKYIIDKEYLLDVYNKKIESTQRSIDDLKTSLTGKDLDIRGKIESQNDKIRTLQKQVKSYNDGITSTIGSINDYKNDLDKLRPELDEAKKNFERLSDKKVKSITDLQEVLKSKRVLEAKGREVIAEINAELRVAKRTIPEGDSCPECLQPITEEHRCNKLEQVQKEIESKTKELEIFKEKLAKVQAVIENIEAEIEDVREHVRKSVDCNHHVNKLKEDINFRESYIATQEAIIKDKRSELKEASDELQEAMETYERLKESAKEHNIDHINSQIDSLNADISKYKKTVKAFSAEVSDLKGQEGALKERIERCHEDIDKLRSEQAKLGELKQQMAVHQLVQNAFSHKGIPTFIIHNILNELQFETNNVLKELRPELEIRLDADLNIEYRRFGSVREYGQLSHGQHCYIALAFKQGLARVIQKKVGIEIKMLQFDEVDMPLDEAGIDALVDVIRKWQKDFKIFVVTHKKELKDKFTHAILVEEGEDGSEARVVTSW